MAGTSWDRLGQVEAAFDAVGPAIHEAAQEAGARVREYHNEDPIWRIVAGPDAYVDVVWDEGNPDAFTVRAVRWVAERPQSEPIGEFARDADIALLKALIASGLARVSG